MNKILSSRVLSKVIWFSAPNTQFDLEDFKTPSRKISLQKFSKKNDVPSTSGFLNSKKCNKIIQYESQLELNFFVLLEHCKKVIFYGHQPLKIEYKLNDYFYSYYPDFYYLKSDGSCVIGEIKTVTEMSLYMNWVKWKALRNYCKKSGLGFLITDGQVAISDLAHKKINQNFRQDLLQEFQRFYSIEWETIYELKEKHKVSMKQLSYIVYQEKIQWHKRPARFVKSQ